MPKGSVATPLEGLLISKVNKSITGLGIMTHSFPYCQTACLFCHITLLNRPQANDAAQILVYREERSPSSWWS